MAEWTPTTLAKEVARIREIKGLSQSDVARRGGLSPSMMSRLEAGEITAPAEETIEKIAQGLDEPSETLLALVAPIRRKKKDSSVLRVGVTHSLWSAPFLPLMVEGAQALEGIEFTTCRRQGGPDPCWLSPDPTRGIGDFTPPRPAGCYEGPRTSNSHPSTASYAASNRTYTASDMLHLMNSGTIDCVVAASQAFEGFSSVLTPCLQIAHVFGGCTLLVVGKDLPPNDDSSVNLNALLGAPVSGGAAPAVPIIYPHHTIADRYVDQLLNRANGRIALENVDLGDWDGVRNKLENLLKDHSRVFLLAWEPQVSWAIKAVEAMNGKRQGESSLEPLTWVERQVGLLLANEGARVPYFTFDLLFRVESEAWRDIVKSGRLERLVALLKRNLQAITDANNPNSLIVQEIAWYLDMGSERCLSALSQCGFSLRFHEEYIQFLRKLL